MALMCAPLGFFTIDQCQKKTETSREFGSCLLRTSRTSLNGSPPRAERYPTDGSHVVPQQLVTGTVPLRGSVESFGFFIFSSFDGNVPLLI